MRIKPVPLQQDIKSVLDYNPDTGIFIWKIRRQKAFNKSGKIAGAKGKKSICIILQDKSYPAHRLAWVYFYGNVLTEKEQVDHINGNPFDNRISNLRLATHAQNCSNARKWKGKLLPKGVSKQTKGDKYRARLQVGKDTIHIGTFDTPEEAHAAYCEAAKKHHGEFARTA